MHRARAVLHQRGVVLRGAVALVLVEAVARQVGVQRGHHAVAGDLGEHGGGSDAGRRAVATDDRDGRRGEPRHAEAVGEHVTRMHGQAGDGPAHALDVGHVQADCVDLRRWDHHHPPGHGTASDPVVPVVPRGRGEQLGVVEAVEASRVARSQHAGRDHQRTGTGTTAGLVDPGDGAEPVAVQRRLQRPRAVPPAEQDPWRPHRRPPDGGGPRDPRHGQRRTRRRRRSGARVPQAPRSR